MEAWTTQDVELLFEYLGALLDWLRLLFLLGIVSCGWALWAAFRRRWSLLGDERGR